MTGSTIALILALALWIGGAVLTYCLKGDDGKLAVYLFGAFVMFLCALYIGTEVHYDTLASGENSFEVVSQTFSNDTFYLDLVKLDQGKPRKARPYKLKYGELVDKSFKPIKCLPHYCKIIGAEDVKYWEKDKLVEKEEVYFVVPIEEK